MSGTRVEAGAVFEVPYPFVRVSVRVRDGEGGSEKIDSWTPGVTPFDDGDEYRLRADGMGQMILRVVSVHKPGKYPERVFFTREWVTPEGKRFGKTGLKMLTKAMFVSRTYGYRYVFEIDFGHPVWPAPSGRGKE